MYQVSFAVPDTLSPRAKERQKLRHRRASAPQNAGPAIPEKHRDDMDEKNTEGEVLATFRGYLGVTAYLSFGRTRDLALPLLRDIDNSSTEPISRHTISGAV